MKIARSNLPGSWEDEKVLQYNDRLKAAVSDGHTKIRKGERQKLRLPHDVQVVVREVFLKKRGVTLERDTGSFTVASDSEYVLDPAWRVDTWFKAAGKAIEFLKTDVKRARHNVGKRTASGTVRVEANGAKGACGLQVTMPNKKPGKKSEGRVKEKGKKQEGKRESGDAGARPGKRSKVEVSAQRERAQREEVLPSPVSHTPPKTCSHRTGAMLSQSMEGQLSSATKAHALQLPPAPRPRPTSLIEPPNWQHQAAAACGTAALRCDRDGLALPEQSRVPNSLPSMSTSQPKIRTEPICDMTAIQDKQLTVGLTMLTTYGAGRVVEYILRKRNPAEMHWWAHYNAGRRIVSDGLLGRDIVQARSEGDLQGAVAGPPQRRMAIIDGIRQLNSEGGLSVEVAKSWAACDADRPLPAGAC